MASSGPLQAEFRRHQSFADKLYRDDPHFEETKSGGRRELARSVANLLKSWTHRHAEHVGQETPEQFILPGSPFSKVGDLIHAGFYAYLPYVLHPTSYDDPAKSELHEWDLPRINGILGSDPASSTEVRGWGEPRTIQFILDMGRQRNPDYVRHASLVTRRVAEVDLALRKAVNSGLESQDAAKALAKLSKAEQPPVKAEMDALVRRQRSEHAKAQAGLDFLRRHYFQDPATRLLMAAKNFVDLQHESYASEKEVRYLALSAWQFHAPFLKQVGLAEEAERLNEMALVAWHPNEHGRIKDYMDRHGPEIDRRLDVLKRFYESALSPHYDVQITHRRKSVFRIWKKTMDKDYEGPEQMGDLGGLRIVLLKNLKSKKGVVTAHDCHKAMAILKDAAERRIQEEPSMASELGDLVTDLGHPRFKNYIAAPKSFDPVTGELLDAAQVAALSSRQRKRLVRYRSLHMPIQFKPLEASPAGPAVSPSVEPHSTDRGSFWQKYFPTFSRWSSFIGRGLRQVVPIGRLRPSDATAPARADDGESLEQLDRMLPPQVNALELQIRTKKMDTDAESGQVSHEAYEGHAEEVDLEPLHRLFFGPVNNPSSRFGVTFINRTNPEPAEPVVHLDVSAGAPVIDGLGKHNEIGAMLAHRKLLVERVDPVTGKITVLKYGDRFLPNDVVRVSKAHPELIPSNEELESWKSLAYHAKTKRLLTRQTPIQGRRRRS